MSPDSGYLSIVHTHALRDPGAVAFEIAAEGRSTRLTYGGLSERVQRLGEALRRAGFRDGACVAVCMENRPAWPVGYLAIWYAGGVTVPLDPAHDEQILARLLEHSGAVACITSEELSTKLRAACALMSTPPLLLCPDRQDREPAAFASWDGDAGDAAGEAPAANDDAGDDGQPEDEELTAIPDLELLASFDAFVDQHGSASGDWRPVIAEDDTLGSIMYTSGTTGDPKGVMIRQNAVLENLRAGVERVHFGPRDRILGVLPLFHVLPLITNCLGPLYVGARVIFLYELTAEAIMDAFRRHDITVFVCVPAFFYRFHDRVTAAIEKAPGLQRRVAHLLLAVSRAARRRFGWSLGRRLLRKVHAPFGSRMRLFITGGAKINTQIYDDFLDWGFTLAQGYGLTEATAIITATPLDDLRGDTVGRPIDGVSVRINEPDDDGVGEVWATGPSLMTGYYRNAEATAEALAGEWLRTGDLGRVLPDGHVQITGRAKDVIVLSSGKNIYPDELEGYYGQSELVDELCVVGIPDEAGRGERLHAIVVPDLDAARRRGYVNVREMIMWELEGMGAKLPGPQRLTSLEIRTEPLPRTPSRKIKRFVLMEELAERGPGGAREEEVRAATEPVELPDWAPQVLEVVARYAKVDAVDPGAHLDLDLGLESLDRIEMLAELEQLRGVVVGEESAGHVHTVAELVGALADAPSATDAGAGRGVHSNWDKVLREKPPGIDRYLARRPLFEPFAWVVLRACRALWGLLAGFRAEGVEELPNDGSFLLCANHASYVDPLFLCMALPRHLLARVFFVGYSEYFEGAVGSRLGRMVRNVPIDPNANLERAMQAAAEGLRRGMILVIFPEGARSIDGTVKEFRRGAATLAKQLDVAIAPAGIAGAFEVWPREGGKHRHPVAITFGRPLAAQPAEADQALVERLRDRVIELQGQSAERLR